MSAGGEDSVRGHRSQTERPDERFGLLVADGFVLKCLDVDNGVDALCLGQFDKRPCRPEVVDVQVLVQPTPRSDCLGNTGFGACEHVESRVTAISPSRASSKSNGIARSHRRYGSWYGDSEGHGDAADRAG